MAPPAEVSEKPVWYRVYVLCVLLVLCICNLATRNLLSYLITVPVPGCEIPCNGVFAIKPLCGKQKLETWPLGTPTRYEYCQLCRAKIVPLGPPPRASGPGKTGSGNSTEGSGWPASASADGAADASDEQGNLHWADNLPPWVRSGHGHARGQIQFSLENRFNLEPQADEEFLGDSFLPQGAQEQDEDEEDSQEEWQSQEGESSHGHGQVQRQGAEQRRRRLEAAALGTDSAEAFSNGGGTSADAGALPPFQEKRDPSADGVRGTKPPETTTNVAAAWDDSFEWRQPPPWANEPGEDASFYNLADGACLYHWEYGILIGFGFASVFAIGSVGAGYVINHRSRVTIASAALMVWSVATALQASAHSFIFLLCCRAVIGLAQAFAMPAAISITADYFSDQQNVAVAVLSVGLYLGSGCASFSILFAEFLGWRWAVLLAGLLGMGLTPVIYHTVQEPPRSIFSAPCPLHVVVDEVFEKSRVARMLTVGACCKMLASYSLSAFLPIWYARRGLIGYTNNAYACWNALVISLGGVLSAILGDLVGQHWSKRDPRAPCWIGVLGAVFSVPLICLVLLTPYFSVSMLCFFLQLLVSESWFGQTVALLQASVRRSVRGQAVSLFLVASSMAANLGPALVGFLDPGGERIRLHLLWISISANLGAVCAFIWTAREISVDPVAAGLGNRPEDDYRESLGNKAGTAHWGLF